MVPPKCNGPAEWIEEVGPGSKADAPPSALASLVNPCNMKLVSPNMSSPSQSYRPS